MRAERTLVKWFSALQEPERMKCFIQKINATHHRLLANWVKTVDVDAEVNDCWQIWRGTNDELGLRGRAEQQETPSGPNVRSKIDSQNYEIVWRRQAWTCDVVTEGHACISSIAIRDHRGIALLLHGSICQDGRERVIWTIVIHCLQLPWNSF